MRLRPKRSFLLASAILLTTGFVAAFAQGRIPGTLDPSVPFAIAGGLYRAKSKIIPVSKIVRGEHFKKSDITLICPPPGLEKTRRLTYNVTAAVSSWDCDEFCSDPALNGRFLATITIDRREHKEPKRGCLTGTWKILNSVGQTVALGTMEGTVRAGTHDVLTDEEPGDCETCGELYHFEGCLKGDAVAYANSSIGQPKCRGPICATFQGIGLDPDRPVPGVTPFVENPLFRMRIEGAMFEACPVISPNPVQGSVPGGIGSGGTRP